MLPTPSLARSLLALALLAACDAPAPADAGLDGAVDAASRRDAGRDAGLLCEPACAAGETCCSQHDGTYVCAQLRNDPRHCGLCEIDCIASHRGDGCSVGQCTCGASSIGCTGNRQSWCCPPRPGTTEAYCADIDRSAADCGACGVECDPRVSDRCDGGRCRCGTGRDACDGTPESICCSNGVDVMCVDTTRDRNHCGRCNNACAAGERCEGGTCTSGAACPGGCAPGEVCCNGICCASPGRCASPACSGGADAGVDGG
ncbi:MAG TPA: hypothetical protein VIL20_08465 [Sandaracinaceae bacterium]